MFGKIILSSLFLVGMVCAQEIKPSHTLHYTKPAGANRTTEALPLGNGALGGMVFGGVDSENIQMNVDSLWTGDDQETGSYQNLGYLRIQFDELSNKVQEYRRSLDIEESIYRSSFKFNGASYNREYFASYPDKVMVLRFDSEKPVSGSILLSDDLSLSRYKTMKTASTVPDQFDKKGKPIKSYLSRLTSKVLAEGNMLGISGALVNDLKYSAQLLVRVQSGNVIAQGDKLIFENVKGMELIYSAETDYKLSFAEKWKGADPKTVVAKRIADASAKSFEALRSAHIKDYQGLYNRLKMDLGSSPERLAKMPTDQRLSAFKASFKRGTVEDVDLQELIANHGRYLMISCSRPGALPANLQGLWNWSNSPPWRSDYHSNINLQMNYWMVEPANLSETMLPLSDYIMAMRDIHLTKTPKEVRHPSGKPATRGWSIKTENGIFGGYSFKWNHPGAAWNSLHLWEHYAFMEDKEFLRKIAYPVLLETTHFWEDRLKERSDGTLVVPKGWSPEHGPTEDGVTYDQQIVYDLFSNYIEAAMVLNIDQKYRKKVIDMRSRLLKNKIGGWGQLQEWETDRDNPKDKHRHVSHLFGLHPGRQISPLATPKLSEAAKVSLNGRGDGGTGWSKAWKISFWARFHDGNRAHKLLSEQITNNFYPNLFDFHAPFQIDGNFGNTAGVLEMLLQSHVRAGENTDDQLAPWLIHLLPALPDNWATGTISGLRARGNIEVDLKWKEGKLELATFKGAADKKLTVYYNGVSKKNKLSSSGQLTLTSRDFQAIK